MVRDGAVDMGEWDEEHRKLGVEEALRVAATPPPIDRLVVCQGDSCTPNTLLSDDGRVSGYVDLGALGVADRWADLAIATWSSVWNYGPGWEERLLEAYGIESDPLRTAYYRLLWDIS
jgi:kanamycin kinase